MTITLITFFLIVIKINLLCTSGPASMGMYQEEFVETGIITQAKFEEIMVLSSMAPGSDAIQLGLLTGRELFGIPGAIVGAIAALTPPISILLIITLLIKFINPTFMTHFFNGIKPALFVLLSITAIKILPKQWNMASLVMLITAVIMLWGVNISATIIMLLFGIIGILIKM